MDTWFDAQLDQKILDGIYQRPLGIPNKDILGGDISLSALNALFSKVIASLISIVIGQKA